MRTAAALSCTLGVALPFIPLATAIAARPSNSNIGPKFVPLPDCSQTRLAPLYIRSNRSKYAASQASKAEPGGISEPAARSFLRLRTKRFNSRNIAALFPGASPSPWIVSTR